MWHHIYPAALWHHTGVTLPLWCPVLTVSCFLCAGTSSGGVKFRGTVEVSNLSDENDSDDLDVSLPLPDHTDIDHSINDNTDLFIDDHIDELIPSRSQCLCVETNPTHRSWTSWRRMALRRFEGFWVTTSVSSSQVCYPECNRTNQSVLMIRIPVLTRLISDHAEFSQGMVLPTSKGAQLPQPETEKTKIQTSKTQVHFSSTKPANSLPLVLSQLWKWPLTSLDAPTDKLRLQVFI